MDAKQQHNGRRSFIGAMTAAGVSMIAGAGADNAQADVTKKSRPICIFTKHLQFLDYTQAAETAAEIGYDGFDIPVRPGGHVLPERVADDLPKAVEAARRAGLDTPMITTAITGIDSPHAEEVLRTAAGLGVKYYRLGYLHYNDALGVAGTLDSYKSRIAELAALNRETGIHGGYQNHAGTNVGAPVWDIWYLMRDLDPRWIGCQYDIRHATAEGGNSWRLSLELLAGHAKTTVIKDFKWGMVDGRWRIVNTPVGDGMVDFDAYYDMVGRLKVTGPISMHIEYPHEQTIGAVKPVFGKDLRALRAMLDKAGLS